MKQTLSTIGLLTICFLLAGCVLPFQSLTTHSEVLALPSGEYLDATWFMPQRIALTYSSSPDTLGLDRYRIVVFETSEQRLKQLAIPHPEDECTAVWTLWTETLPGNRLGATRLCWFWIEHASNRYTEILAYDSEQERLEIVSKSPVGEDVVSFSFKPDMSASLQTFDSSGGLVGQVVWVNQSGAVTSLFENFSRTRDASFSPTGEAFAFLGTERLPVVDGGLFGWQLAYQQQLAYPWTLYVVDSAGTVPRPVVNDIRYARNAKWSPTGPYVAFEGEMQGFQGIWVVHLDTGRVYRVWDKSLRFDWSPDGQQIVVLDAPPMQGQKDSTPRLVLLTLSLPE